MITGLQFQHIKGRSGSHKFGKVTAIVGENRAGKTAVLAALNWGILDYIPSSTKEQFKTNQAVFKFASWPFMETFVATDGGSVRRRLTRSGDTVKSTTEGELEFPPILLDSSLYWNQSEPERIRTVAALVRMEALPGFSVPEILAGVKNIRLEENTVASEEAVLRAYTSLSEQQKAEPLDWLAVAVKSTSESLSLAKKAQGRFTGLGIALTQLQAQDSEQEQASGATEGLLRQARTELGALQEVSGNLAFKVNDEKKKAARKADLEAVQRPTADIHALSDKCDVLAGQVSAAQRLVQSRKRTVTELFGDVSRLQAEKTAKDTEYSQLLKKRKSLEAVTLPEGAEARTAAVAKLEQQLKVIDATLAERKESNEELATKVAEVKASRDAAAAEYKAIKANIEAAERSIAELVAIECCPSCHANVTAEWKAQWKADKEKEIVQFNINLHNVTVKGTDWKAKCGSIELKQARRRSEDAVAAQTRQQLEAAKAAVAHDAVKSIAYNTAQSDSAALNVRDVGLQCEQEEINNKLTTAKQEYDIAAAESAALDSLTVDHSAALAVLASAKEDASKWTATEAELLSLRDTNLPAAQSAYNRQQELVAAKQTEIGTLEGQMRAVQLARADLKRQMDAVAAAERATAEVEVLKATKVLLEKKQAELVSTAFKELLTTVNKFTSFLLPQLEYRDELGYWAEPTVWASASTFSGAEQLVTYVGLQVALAARAPQKIVILDEVTRAIGSTKRNLLERLQELCVDGTIDQAIIADAPDEFLYKPSESLTVISV